MRRWLHAHADTIADPAWRPDLCARRLQFWAAHAPLILSSTDLIYRSRVLNTLARGARHIDRVADKQPVGVRSEEHTSELQSLMRISYAVFCLKKKITISNKHPTSEHVT